MHKHIIFRTGMALVAMLVSGVVGAWAAPYPPDGLTAKYQAAAQYIVAQSGVSKGYCCVFGAGQGRLAYEMSLLAGNLRFIGIEENSSLVDSGRTALNGEDLYGYKISLHQGSLSAVKYHDYAAVLVVSDAIIANGVCPGLASEMFRMVRPAGGVAIIGQPANCPIPLSRIALENWLNAAGLAYTITEDSNGLWARVNRGPLSGAGEWSHMWANPGNTGCSEDQLANNSVSVLWYGGPGPKLLVDRHNRPMASLFKAGRLIVPGDNRVDCLDAYNGARLWEMVVANSARIAIQRDAGWVAMDDSYVYIAAQNNCYKVNLNTGATANTFQSTAANRDWGYLGVDGDLLIGSNQINGASIIGPRSDGGDIAYGDSKDIITSKALFCRNKISGALIWTYDNSTVITNPAICVSEDAVYFYESNHPDATGDADGRVPLGNFFKQSAGSLVKINKNSGNLVWRVPASPPFAHVIYLSYANNVVLATGSYTLSSKIWYQKIAYNPANGSVLWSKDNDSGYGPGLNHGEQDKRSMIIGNNVYHKFGCYNLLTGATVNYSLTTSNCADSSASASCIYSRDGGFPSGASTSGGASVPLCNEMRPGCYITIIPAGGLIFLPSYAAGCSCGPYTLLTTVAWQPQ